MNHLSNADGPTTVERPSSLTVFVSMPFSRDFDDVYNFGITPIRIAFPGWTLNVVRADTVSREAPELRGHVISLLIHADLVIADITGNNINVIYEIGYANGRQKKVILISSKDEPVPSTLQGLLYLKYDKTDPVKLMKLTSDLVAAIASILRQFSEDRLRGLEPGAKRIYWSQRPEAIKHRPELPKPAAEYRDLAKASRDRGMLEEAAEYLIRARATANHYWEATYDLAFVRSRQKFEEEALELADEALDWALRGRDYVCAYKCRTLSAGIYYRSGRLPEAVAHVRLAYFFSHLLQCTQDGNEEVHEPHVITILNRWLYEGSKCGDSGAEAILLEEMQLHPDYRQVQSKVEDELQRRASMPRGPEGNGQDYAK